MQNDTKQNLIFILGALIVTAIVIGVVMFFDNAKSEKEEEKTSREVALECTTDMATTFHIHPEIYIKILGEDFLLPANIGIKDTCMNSIHTHDGGGLVHVEAPVKKDFTLGDFFAVWDKPFNQNQIMEFITDPTSKIIVTVNDKVVDTYENTLLNDLDKIVISYTKI
jgi:hypothetical protein